MTFREYAKQKCDITDEQMDEGFHCPCFVGLLDMCNDGNGDCEKCWNREIPETPAPMTAEEAWDIAIRFCYGDLNRANVRKAVFGDTGLYACMNLPIQEIKEKIDEYDKNKVQVGDVCKVFENSCVITRVDENEKQYVVIWDDGDTDKISFDATLKLTKTGKHIDIQSVLDRIGGGKDE